MWEIDINDQIVTLLLSLVLGVAVCVLYDIFRAIRCAVDHSAVAVFFEDILFWVLAALVNFIFLMGRTGGGLRGYVFVGEIAGFFVFRFTVSRVIVSALSWTIAFAVKIYGTAVDKTADLFWSFWGILRRVFGFLQEKSKRVIKSAKKLLKSRAHMLYTETNSVDREDTDVC